MRLLRPSALPTLRAAPRPRSKACARVVLHRPQTTRYTATMEPGAASQEQADFTNVAVTRYAAAGHNGSAAVARLGLGSGQQTGPAKTLQVAKGDTITFTAYAWLTAVVAAASNSTSPKNPPLVLPAPQPNTAPPAAPGADGAPTKRSGLPTVGISVALPIGGPDDATPQGGGAPGIARLHYRVLDAQGTVLLDDYQTANGTTPATWQTLQVGLRLPQAGSVQLSVETNGAAGPTVYFDDVAVEQTGGLIVQEQHQYAFGAPLPGLSYSVGSTRYRHGYQGQYADKDEETGFDSFELRLYNSRIGRWTAPDPYGQFDSPYVGVGNNPVMGTDPDGGFALPTWLVGGAERWGLLHYVGSGLASTGLAIGKGIAAASTAARQGNSNNWRPFTKANLEDYYSQYHNGDSGNNSDLGNAFETIFRQFATTKWPAFHINPTVNPGDILRENTGRNTLPDFIGLGLYQNKAQPLPIQSVPGGSFYEVKAYSGRISLSSNKYQIKGHIDNLISRMVGISAYQAGVFYPSFTLVTTADVPVSQSIISYAFFHRVTYRHISAQYRRTSSGGWEFNFELRYGPER